MGTAMRKVANTVSSDGVKKAERSLPKEQGTKERPVSLARLSVLALARQLQHAVSPFQLPLIIFPQREKLTSVFKVLKLQGTF